MEIGKQIKKLRTHLAFSQDDLAMRVYVSRQTISNWENNRNYPDVKSLLLLSSLFNVSLDQLVKGDVEEMKNLINAEEKELFRKDGTILMILFIVTIISLAPLFLLLEGVGMVIWGLIVIAMLYYAFRIEKYKKNYDVQTYREIMNFIDGKSLDAMEKQQEFGKRHYQKFLLAVGGAIVAAVIAGGLIILIDTLLG
ncbi:MAG: helix-turn-helix transcriptional regulator [Clostridiales bacterium]|nr:helix-turn-helix transcriptional regulator [Clostridiales bacterium]